MKRDNDLLRDILLTVEACPDVPPKTLRIESFLDYCDNPAIISLHIGLLQEAGLIEADRIQRNDGIKGWDIKRLTFAGYEYLDTIRSAKVWRNVKQRLQAAGGATLDIIKAVAVSEIKKELDIER